MDTHSLTPYYAPAWLPKRQAPLESEVFWLENIEIMLLREALLLCSTFLRFLEAWSLLSSWMDNRLYMTLYIHYTDCR